MIWDELESYISRKELSKKAVDEICKIIVSEEYSTDEEINSLVKVLLKLKSVVLYSFITSGAKVLNKEVAAKIVSRIDVSNPQKAGHIYCMAIALDKANFTAEANSLLLKFVRTNVSKKMSNQLIEGFKQAIKYGYDTFLFSKFEGWTSRDINLYGLLLNKSAEVLDDIQFTEAVKACADKNSAMIGNPVKESNEVSHDVRQVPIVKDPIKETINIALPEQKESKSSLSLDEIFSLLKQKFEESQNIIKSKDSELNELKATITNLKAGYLDLESRDKKLATLYENEHSKLVSAETSIKKFQQKLTEAETELADLNSKLSNVVSAYGQAGQNEIDSMKENISRRLTSEYKKYQEIKAKGVDIDYYDMLIFILDEVFKVLKKNGIAL